MTLSLALTRPYDPRGWHPRLPGCLDVDDSGLDRAVVDVMMRHQVQGQRPKLGHIEQRLGGRIPRSEGENPGKGKRNGHAR